MQYWWEHVEPDSLLRLLETILPCVILVLAVQQLRSDVVFEGFVYWIKGKVWWKSSPLWKVGEVYA